MAADKVASGAKAVGSVSTSGREGNKSTQGVDFHKEG